MWRKLDLGGACLRSLGLEGFVRGQGRGSGQGEGVVGWQGEMWVCLGWGAQTGLGVTLKELRVDDVLTVPKPA